MFGRSRPSQLKLAEAALADGRLDEAFQRATGRDLADDSRARRLLADLCEPLLRRAQDHLISERFTDALADIDRAARCGVLRDKVEDWRQRALSAMQDRQHQKREQQQVIDAARRALDDGQVTLARDQIDEMSSHPNALALQNRAGRQADAARHALAEANAALARGDLMAAARAVAAARRLHAGADELDATEDAVCSAVLNDARTNFSAGRLDRVREVLDQLGDVGRRRPQRIDLDRAVGIAAEAASEFRAADYHEADILLGRLAQIAGDAPWIGTTRESLRVLAAQAAAVAAGPLGLVSGGVATPGRKIDIAFDETASIRPLPGPPPVIVPPLDSRLLLRIDGVGTFLLLRGDRVVIGRAGPGSLADLPLVSDLSENAAQIIRSGEDYFLLAAAAATVGGQPVRQALLSQGDRIGLGRRVRLAFQRPSRKSGAAVIELASGLRAIADVRRVILLGGPVLIGNTAECHIPVPGVNLVLSERGGQMAVREIAANRGGVGASVPLVPGQLAEIAGVRLSLSVPSSAPSIGNVVG